jgi:electron transfer flavoprotein alpha subunit
MKITDKKTRTEYKNIWVVAETAREKIHPVTFELLTAAAGLAEVRKSEVWVVVLGGNLPLWRADLARYGADTILHVPDASGGLFLEESAGSELSALIRKHKPEIVLCGATSLGRAVFPRVAVEIEAGLTADCTELSIDEETGLLLQTRPAFGGNLFATIKSENHLPQMATVRPGVFRLPASPKKGRGRVLTELSGGFGWKDKKKILSGVFDSLERIDLTDAHYIIAGGRGVKGERGFALIRELADILGGAVGATRAAVELGWIPGEHQIGQTGKTVQSKVYIACGISGQVQHLVGMHNSECIIAINNDANAPIMKMADIAVVGDVLEVLPALIEELKRKRDVLPAVS